MTVRETCGVGFSSTPSGTDKDATSRAVTRACDGRDRNRRVDGGTLRWSATAMTHSDSAAQYGVTYNDEPTTKLCSALAGDPQEP